MLHVSGRQPPLKLDTFQVKAYGKKALQVLVHGNLKSIVLKDYYYPLASGMLSFVYIGNIHAYTHTNTLHTEFLEGNMAVLSKAAAKGYEFLEPCLNRLFHSSGLADLSKDAHEVFKPHAQTHTYTHAHIHT